MPNNFSPQVTALQDFYRKANQGAPSAGTGARPGMAQPVAPVSPLGGMASAMSANGANNQFSDLATRMPPNQAFNIGSPPAAGGVGQMGDMAAMYDGQFPDMNAVNADPEAFANYVAQAKAEQPGSWASQLGQGQFNGMYAGMNAPAPPAANPIRGIAPMPSSFVTTPNTPPTNYSPPMSPQVQALRRFYTQ